ncbi:hypothetical protein [Helicobacter himalayensis]|uniref:hypothetical protein n=1 Tax=Helicobacter himalayensis TaxID=1591088 RepID=UPI0008348E78|nr:hypothetical protein [Helicobacter himalayensis]
MGKDRTKWNNRIKKAFGEEEAIIFNSFDKRIRNNYISHYDKLKEKYKPSDYLLKRQSDIMNDAGFHKSKEIKEIAQALGESTTTINKIYNSAMQKIRDYLKEKQGLKASLRECLNEDFCRQRGFLNE